MYTNNSACDITLAEMLLKQSLYRILSNARNFSCELGIVFTIKVSYLRKYQRIVKTFTFNCFWESCIMFMTD